MGRQDSAVGGGGGVLPGPRLAAFAVLVSFLLAVALLVQLGYLPRVVIWIYLGASLIAFVFYGLDKLAARWGWQRVAENTLHLVDTLGGWPGALFAQQLFRHKSVKRAFRVVYWLTVLANLALLAFLFTPPGQRAIGLLRYLLQ